MMATAESIAIRNELALERLNQNLVVISERFNVEPPTITTQYRDLAELPTMQLEELAAWSEQVTSDVKEHVNGNS
jgi:hypothetical protein